MKSGRVAYQAVLVRDLYLLSRTRPVVYFSDEFNVKSSSLGRIASEIATQKNSHPVTIEDVKSWAINSDVLKMEGIVLATELDPGDYIGLYGRDELYGTGMLRDSGEMMNGLVLYEVLLVINIF